MTIKLLLEASFLSDFEHRARKRKRKTQVQYASILVT